ncbi:DUF4360 domain-containing protein [Oculatella sp. FACHB-28]|uniref:DUF4360 domain-containing protein n=1 Tax=Oculatella sp. FACHB-28 TaxID=2692845 RepID=UPI0016878EFF|nr:DUF4360 domain-containing protein [Oculatella sp. FACHB-28]MBD2054611.1 DUF4360 domain-containing protein [Oculatella sp. FACHB-28]
MSSFLQKILRTFLCCLLLSLISFSTISSSVLASELETEIVDATGRGCPEGMNFLNVASGGGISFIFKQFSIKAESKSTKRNCKINAKLLVPQGRTVFDIKGSVTNGHNLLSTANGKAVVEAQVFLEDVVRPVISRQLRIDDIRPDGVSEVLIEMPLDEQLPNLLKQSICMKTSQSDYTLPIVVNISLESTVNGVGSAMVDAFALTFSEETCGL